jgi:hypothetical protein
MRRAVQLLLAPVVALLVTACSGTPDRSTAGLPPGCGMVPPARVTGLVGDDVRTTVRGSLDDLRTRHRTAVCTTRNRDHPDRYVRIVARYHPAPMRISRSGCGDGQVFAGTPAKFAPACQDTVGRRRTTRLTVRWQPYVMEVTVGRLDPYWAGDAELALAMSRLVARRLHVAEATGSG